MTNEEQKLREFADKWGFSQDKTDEGFLIDNDKTKQCLSDLTALIEEHYTANEEVEKMVEENLREELTNWADYWNRIETGHACIMKEDIDEYLKTRER